MRKREADRLIKRAMKNLHKQIAEDLVAVFSGVYERKEEPTEGQGHA